MSFDILREWDLESFDPGLEFFPETERTTSLDVVTPANEDVAPEQVKFETPQADEMAREAASPNGNNFAADMVVNQGNHDFDLDFDVTEDIMAMWESESAARAQEDRDDLERERAGVGRKHERFGVERTDGAGGRVSNARQAADMLSDMQQMQTQKSYAQKLDDFNTTSEAGSDALQEEIDFWNRRIAELEERRQQMLDTTLMMGDTRVFVTDEGVYVDSDGNALSADDQAAVAARVAEGANVNNYEDFDDTKDHTAAAIYERDQAQDAIAEWDSIQDRLEAGEITLEQATEEQNNLRASLSGSVAARLDTALAASGESQPQEQVVAEAGANGFSLDLSSIGTDTSSMSFADSLDISASIQTQVQLAECFTCAVMDEPLTPTQPETAPTNDTVVRHDTSGFSISFD